MTDYERLRMLAENATPGPWQYNAEFIAAADPDTIRNLLEDLRIIRAERDAEKRTCLVLRKQINHARADAWDEGALAGHAESWSFDEFPNPYRPDTQDPS